MPRLRPSSSLVAVLFLLTLGTGCSNVIRAGLMNSNTIFLDPNMNRTIYVQLRNTSENQGLTLNEIDSKLAVKGYQLMKDPGQANYWLQAKVIYCHKAADSVTPEAVAKAGFGAGISSGGTTMVTANTSPGGGMAGMFGGTGAVDMNAMMRMAMAGRGMEGGFPGMQPPPKEEGVTYLCVADVQITDRKIGKTIGGSAAGQDAGAPKVQQMRTVGHVRQKDLDIPEATPIIADKITTGITGLF
jgi:hypothetical protein